MINSGPAIRTASPRCSVIIVHVRNRERQTEPISSDAAPCRCGPMTPTALRMIRPTIRHHRNAGTVIPPPSNALPSAWPATTAARAAASDEINDNAVTGVLTGPPTTPPSAAAVVASARTIRRISRSATGPPMIPPRIKPIVAEVIVNPITPRISCSSAKRRQGRAGAVAAHQGDRARHQPEHGVQAQETRHRHAQRILRQQERKQGEQEAQQARPAPPKHGEVGSQTNRGKKQQQEWRLRGCIERHAESGRSLRQQRQDRENQAADDRGRDAVAHQQRYALRQ